MAGEGLGRDVGEVLELFLAAAGRSTDALPEPDERIQDERRAGQADEREARVVPEEDADVPDERERFPDQIADRLGHRLLDLADVVGDA